MDEHDSTILKRQTEEKNLLLEKLKEIGIVSAACQKAGIGRATFYRWVKEDPTFKRRVEKAKKIGIQAINDMAETSMVSLIREKKLPAINLWLKHNHSNYKQTTPSTAVVSEKNPFMKFEERTEKGELKLYIKSLEEKVQEADKQREFFNALHELVPADQISPQTLKAVMEQRKEEFLEGLEQYMDKDEKGNYRLKDSFNQEEPLPQPDNVDSLGGITNV